MKQETLTPLNIRYLGFECIAEGGRRLDFSVTGPGRAPVRATFNIPGRAYSGLQRITFQESATLCCAKLRDMLDQTGEVPNQLLVEIGDTDIERFRPKGRRAPIRVK